MVRSRGTTIDSSTKTLEGKLGRAQIESNKQVAQRTAELAKVKEMV